MAQQSARRGQKNQGFPQCFEHAFGDLDLTRELPYRPATARCRIRGRTDGSIRLRAITIPKISLAQTGASTDGSGTIEAARVRALESCAAKGGTDCAPYAENLDLVRPGLLSQTPAPPAALLSTWNYEAIPDNRYYWRGPAMAAGVYVWAHGFEAMNGNGALGDARGLQPQPHVRTFNNGGFDVVRFDRHPNVDGDRERVGGWLEDVLADLRRRGYRKIVVGGQSRGGWNALQMLRTRGLADVVIAVSPAAHGSGSSTNLSAQYDDLRQMVADIPAAATRLAFVQFAADPFAGDLVGRAALVERLRPRLGGLLVVDQPEGFSGHYGGVTALFARRYGECLLRFATEAIPRRAC